MAKNKSFGQMSFTQIAMQQTLQAVDAPVYCRLCGRNVKEPSSKSPPGNNGAWMRYLDLEIANKCHVSCYQEEVNKQRGQ
ncbi:hypothetical protein GZH47_33715 (plasmid) [Paenibacillus rhizovicinus]|uniref:Uncharacterized protein n=1 Tax=Paenibacillus rhizovicinus TaxID=2704463 RepID=A0A6C0PBR2_9BACL|nr:hypothetical protein [Paenibacillus rhizovicinus]QHW35851.1 hypothetical protein GZH47_33715 [Paenibacillus rhizovicinus]